MKKLIKYGIILSILFLSCSRNEHDEYSNFSKNYRIINKSKSSVWNDLPTILSDIGHTVVDSDQNAGLITAAGDLSLEKLKTLVSTQEYNHITTLSRFFDTTKIQIVPMSNEECRVIINTKFFLKCNQEIPRGKFSFDNEIEIVEASKGVFENTILDRLDK